MRRIYELKPGELVRGFALCNGRYIYKVISNKRAWAFQRDLTIETLSGQQWIINLRGSDLVESCTVLDWLAEIELR